MILSNCRIFDGNILKEGQYNIYLEKDRIFDIKKYTYITDSIDIKGCIAVPGYIDIHTHGIHGMDFSYSSGIDDKRFFDSYVKSGTTSVFPTTVSMDINQLKSLLSKYIKVKHPAFCGIHLEGPFLNQNRAGAHNKEYIIPPSLESYLKISEGYEKIISRITIACELDEGYKLAEYLLRNKKIVSFGHTECSSLHAYEAFKAGYRLSTHHFNAMPLMHHRDVTITGAALLDDSVSCEYIPDFYHISKDMLKILFKCKKSENLVMVTDSISAAEMPDGSYNLGGLNVNVKDGLVKDKSGTIAGSSITMAKGVLNMINSGFNPITVLKSATSIPARLMNLKNRGLLKNGYYADVNILDSNFKYLFTISRGIRVN
ncbi:MAG: N-acetylglucosamine-6-phosphate deacetylase [Clostridia bacterium]|jgi:N-acetylglucosamine-6-phosphate deacetylase|nr:N-acetylglucosamine-6-phosphate deacetylase [Clostridia bacterium]